MEKIKEVLKFFLIITIFLLLTKTSYALGVTPSRTDINFAPKLEATIPYYIVGNDANRELEVSAEGELGKYVKFDKTKITGEGRFIVTLKLPKNVETPGKNVIYIRVKEKFDDELLGGGVGTSINIGVLITIQVPYPGRHLDLTLSSQNVNVGEPVDFILGIKSQGSETVVAKPRIDILSGEKIIETLELKDREVKSQEEIKLKKTLDTTDYNPGKYRARAIVEYGNIATAEAEFRIGDLIINLIDYTKRITIGGLRAFELDIESGWNDPIDGAYGIISIFNESGPIIEFKTETTGLTAWEEKTIKGHFDSSNFIKGVYDTNITLVYFGKERGRSTSEMVKVEFVEEFGLMMIALIAGGIILLVAIVIIITRYFVKNKGNEKK